MGGTLVGTRLPRSIMCTSTSRMAADPPAAAATSIGTAKPMPMKNFLVGRVGQRRHDADDLAVSVQQRSTRIAGVHRRIELDQPFEHIARLGGPEVAVQPRDHAGRDRVSQAEGVPDGNDLVADSERCRTPQGGGNHQRRSL